MSTKFEIAEENHLNYTKMNILIIGYGIVGKATHLLQNKNVDFYIYDINPNLCSPINLILKDILPIIDLIFISVPTPLNIDGTCHTGIIDKTLKLIQHDYIIIRSTIPIGYCDDNNVFFMPEFLTEKNWEKDFVNNKYWFFGIPQSCDDDRKTKFMEKVTILINSAYNNGSIMYNNIIFHKNSEMEMLKMIKNTYLSTKISYFNEIYDLTNKIGLNYDAIIDLLKLDERIGPTHMKCPGFDNKRGYGGTCFPKDTLSFYYQFSNHNLHSQLLESNLSRNEYIDRVEKDWLIDINRTIVENSKKIILVTGGAGFIGSHLCHKLVNMDYEIICMDNLITGKMENIMDLLDKPNFKFIKFDIQHKLFIPKVDLIYHLASLASPEKYKKYPIETLLTSTNGTYNILELCKQQHCKMLFTSTSEVYGDPLVHPQPETYYGNVNTMGERSCYDEGKRVVETMIYEYRKKYELDLKIVRLFNTYGPKMNIDDGRVITNFIKNIIDNKPLEIYGDGNQTRSFCYIDDMIDALIKMMDSNETGPINLGNPYCEFTLNKLVHIFEDVIGKKIEVNYLPMTQDDPKQRKPVIDSANEKLAWNPTTDLMTGIQNTILSFGLN